MPQIEHDPFVTHHQGRILLVDESLVRGWHKQGEHSRLHVSYDLRERRITQVVLTNQKTGESLCTFAFMPGDILVADRGYCRRRGIWEVVEAGGLLVVRLHWNNVPVAATKRVC